jgi:uncharacterized membrane protein YecN with MAPEG domain
MQSTWILSQTTSQKQTRMQLQRWPNKQRDPESNLQRKSRTKGHFVKVLDNSLLFLICPLVNNAASFLVYMLA